MGESTGAFTMSHKLDDDELGSDTAPRPQEMLSGYSHFTWLHGVAATESWPV